MKKFEYKHLTGNAVNDDLLNEYGAEGWELVSVIKRLQGDYKDFVFYLKREKLNDDLINQKHRIS